MRVREEGAQGGLKRREGSWEDVVVSKQPSVISHRGSELQPCLSPLRFSF